MKVAVLGASDKPERYSFKAIKLLGELGHEAYPVHPRLAEVLGRKVYPDLAAVPVAVDTVAVYLAPEHSEKIAEVLRGCAARRFIFPPGAENPGLEARLREQGKEVLEACPLVMLRTGQF